MRFSTAVTLLVVVSLSGCASKTWKHVSGNNSNLSYASSQCRNYATLNYPTYVCKVALRCTQQESGLIIQSFRKNTAAFEMCMNKNGYRAVRK